MLETGKRFTPDLYTDKHRTHRPGLQKFLERWVTSQRNLKWSIGCIRRLVAVWTTYRENTLRTQLESGSPEGAYVYITARLVYPDLKKTHGSHPDVALLKNFAEVT